MDSRYLNTPYQRWFLLKRKRARLAALGGGDDVFVVKFGVWDDAGTWIDTDVWADSAPNFVITGGVWVDTGIWNDSSTWVG